MEPSFEEQFAAIVRRASIPYRAHLCDGDPTAAVVWDPESEITVRLGLRGDEVWAIAGSGVLVRFVAASDGTFSDEAIDTVIGTILRGKAIEYFGVRDRTDDDTFATGFDTGPETGFAGGLNARESRFAARLAGPMAVASLDTCGLDDGS